MQPQTHPITHLDIEADRESLRLHAMQASGSRTAIWVLFSLIMVAVYPSLPAWRVLSWGLPMLAAGQFIHTQCRHILSRIDGADAAAIRQLHARMRWTTVVHQGLIGTTVWWFGWPHNVELALVGTALQLIYAGAAMANGAVNVKTFILGTWLNLLSATAYWFWLETHRWPVGLALLGAAFVMSRLSKTMASGFRESLRMRFENNDLLKRLAEEKRVAEEATQFKSRFLANVSHEIRTPVGAILGMCYLTLKTELSPKQRQYLQIVLQSSEHLSKLLNQVLDFSKVEARMLTLEKDAFSLNAVLEQVHSQHASQAQDKQLSLTSTVDAEVPQTLEGDALRLREILTNYVSNAIKFTHHGGVQVHVRLQERTLTQAVLRFDVKDSGIGLSVDQAGCIFDSFRQADASITRQYGGTGLGLAIAKNLAELMNGTVGVASVLGQGSTFWFTAQFDLPPSAAPPVADDVTILLMSTHPPLNPAPVSSMLSDADRQTAGQHICVLAQLVAASNPHAQTWVAQHAEQLEKGWPHLRAGLVAAIDQFDWARAETLLANFGCTTDTVWPATPVPQRHTVLVVDDNPVNLALMVDLLSPLYEVRATLSGARALHIARVQRVDLVLLDVMMPIMDGHEVCKRLQALPEMAHCPILFLTAQNQIKDTEYGLALGAQDYIAKPISPPLVLKRIETHLALQAFRRQAGQADPAFLAGDPRAVPASAR